MLQGRSLGPGGEADGQEVGAQGGASRAPDAGWMWAWPWLPSVGIAHVQVFLLPFHPCWTWSSALSLSGSYTLGRKRKSLESPPYRSSHCSYSVQITTPDFPDANILIHIGEQVESK